MTIFLQDAQESNTAVNSDVHMTTELNELSPQTDNVLQKRVYTVNHVSKILDTEYICFYT